MAGTMYCDNEAGHAGQDQPTAADWLLTNLTDGQTLALCNADYLTFSAGLVAQAQAQADAEAQAEADAEADRAATEAEKRLRSAGPAKADPATAPKVVKRGTSRSRQAYEARRRQPEPESEPESEPEPEPEPAELPPYVAAHEAIHRAAHPTE
jgi:hypothetical protein